MLHRILDQLLQFSLHTLQTSNVLPCNIGHLDHSFSERARIRLSQSPFEVFLRHSQRIEHLSVNVLLFQVNKVHFFSYLLEGGLGAQRGQIGAHISMGLVANLFQVNIIGQLHVLGVNSEHFETTNGVRYADVDLAVKTAKATQSGINAVRPIGGGHDHYMRTLLQTVHQSQQLGHNTALYFAVRFFPLGRNRGAFFSAVSKALRKLLSDSPANFDIISGPLIKKKKAPVSLATARAIKVLPVPGGPNKRMPLGGLTPIVLNSWGCLSGNSTISLICASCFLTPPMSS
ncbi:hypothetical protein BpHYR1_024705 [Brachionus plicatilis]|uniref:Uncharacterized protein n=1 Tax=Brachionus plicatilis TaxID=10195 RepID=A0A3M7SBN8_BRAPC|nr:hypothetical protein BpHYR1_024705 [Brachionus plicatilis]